MMRKKLPDPLAVATSLCQKLFEAGYIAYFAGGYVRDLLLGNTAPEIDIATSASPEKVASLFSKTVPVGREFGVMIVIEEGIQFEVTTFRKDHPYQDGRHPEGVDFSTPEKDAARRDFTINGMFYDPLTKEIYDFVGGKEDLKGRLIRAIGDPLLRFAEDRLRMIRAVRFAARYSFAIEEKTEEAIKKNASTLFPSVSMERIWQELQKMAAYPNFDRALLTLQELGLLSTIFPDLTAVSISSYVACFADFPLGAPTITYLIQLFPNATLEKRIELGRYLKVSNEELKLLTFFHASDKLNTQTTKYEWAKFYAHPKATLYLEVKKSTLPLTEQPSFVEEHEMRQLELHEHIARLKAKNPLVTSDDLKARGIAPGKQMGELLTKAAHLSVNENLTSKEALLQRLFP